MNSVKCCTSSLALALLVLAVPVMQGQTATVLSHSVISAIPPDTTSYEKAIGNFTNTSYPSFFLGTNAYGYLYDGQSGGSCGINVPANYYESASAFTYPGDQYAGVMASLYTSTVWLENPLNYGGTACDNWQVQPINPGQAAHQVRLADLDGDGLLDVLGSGIDYPLPIYTGFMSFQNTYNSWSTGAFPPPAGGSIDVIAINGGARNNIVACNPNNNALYWYANPGGALARSAVWIPNLIAATVLDGQPACTVGSQLSTLNVGNRDIVIVANGEAPAWSPGLGYFDPNPDGTWTFYQLDATYVDVHQISTDVLNGVPFFAIAEQEQASTVCNSAGYNDHGSLYSGCRVAIFAWNGSGFSSPTLVSNLGSHNQTLYQLNGAEYMVGANHREYGATDPAYNLWQFNFTPNTGSAFPSSPQHFVPVTPCRVADTRTTAGPILAGGSTRNFAIAGTCGVPSTASAYSINVTVVPTAVLGFLTAWPTGQPQPLASLLNSDGRIKANAAIVPAGTNGAISMYATNETQVVIDVNGYFVPSGTDPPVELAFYPVTPCRILDTRNSNGPLGGPMLSAGSSRAIPVLSGGCSIPATAQAYSMNFTAIPTSALSYLTTWPTGAAQPYVSTLNASTGTITANAAIVPAGVGGQISLYVTDNTDLAVDINGYFAPITTGAQSFYNVSTCRTLDTRSSGNGAPVDGTLTVNLLSSICLFGAQTASAVVLNVTAVPTADLSFLSVLAPGGSPTTSTLNADDGAITSNLAIAPTVNGSVQVYTPSQPSQVILDVWGYFAP